MKFVLFLFTLATLTANPAQAFLVSQEKDLLLKAMNNATLNKDVVFEDIRCSLRTRSCLVRFQVQNKSAGCLIEKLQDASDLYVEINSENQTHRVLSPYTEQILAACVASLL